MKLFIDKGITDREKKPSGVDGGKSGETDHQALRAFERWRFQSLASYMGGNNPRTKTFLHTEHAQFGFLLANETGLTHSGHNVAQA